MTIWPARRDAQTDRYIRAFLDDIAESPDDPGVRLIFADWLEEHGDPRSEVVRSQAAYLQGEDRDNVEKRLGFWLEKHGHDWLGELPFSSGDGLGFCLYRDRIAIGGQWPLLQPLLRGDPKLEGLRQALREGWIRIFWIGRWRPAEIVRAAESGLLSGQGELLLSGLFTDYCLSCLAAQTQLRTLELDKADAMTDHGLALLASLVRLRGLSLRNLIGFTGSGLAHLNSLKRLQLCVSDCPRIVNSALASLRAFPELERLTLVRCAELDDDGLAHLAALSGLRVLDLQGNKGLNGTGLKHLGELSALTSLNLASCPNLTGDGLAHLKGLHKLEWLDLFDCPQITAAGAAHLHEMKSLKWLRVSACKLKPHVTPRLRKALPDCQVVGS